MVKMRERDLLALAAVVVIVLAVLSFTGGGMGMMGSWMMGPLGGGWGGLGMILFWVLIGLGIYLLWGGYARPRRGREERALAIARERYAGGEITREEYEEIRRNLSGS